MNMWRFKEEHFLPSRFDTYTEDMQPETQKPEMQTGFDYPGTHKRYSGSNWALRK